MKLIKQTQLHLQEGNSDKVYEIDLCQVGEGQYVVNFRYGRRGASLNEGTKTVQPVSMNKAQAVFDDLVKDKTKKGYKDVSGKGIAGTEYTAKPSGDLPPDEARQAAILRRLQLAVNTPNAALHKKWKPSRVAWRAGKLGIAQAAPLLVQLVQANPGKEMLRYCCLYALGQCAPKSDASATAFLLEFYKNPENKRKETQRRAAAVSLLRLTEKGSPERRAWAEHVLSQMPPSFQDQVLKGNKTTLLRLLDEQRKRYEQSDEWLVDADNRSALLGKELARKLDFVRTETIVQGGESLRLEHKESLEVGHRLNERDLQNIPQGTPLYLTKTGDRSRQRPARYLEQLYLLGAEYAHLRPALYELLPRLPLAPGLFKPLRHIFKAAEQGDDDQMLGLLGYKMDKTKGTFYKTAGIYSRKEGAWLYARNEVQREDSLFAYSHDTRSYFLTHTEALLEEWAESAPVRFAKAAAALLRHYDDGTDAKFPPRTKTKWYYNYTKRQWENLDTRYSPYEPCYLFHRLLFADSPRMGRRGETYAYRTGFTEESPPPAGREEAYQKAWDSYPMAYVYLLLEARSVPVQEFALRALTLHPQYTELSARFGLEQALHCLRSRSSYVALYGLTLARKLYNPEQPNTELTLTMLEHREAAVREQARLWIQENLERYLRDTEFVKNALTHRMDDVRQWMADSMPRVLSLLDEERRRILVVRLLSFLLQALPAEQAEQWVAFLFDRILVLYLDDSLCALNIEVIGDMLASPHAALRTRAARLLLRHRLQPEQMPFDLLARLVESNEPEQLLCAGTLLAAQPSERLFAYRDRVYEWSINKSEAMRGLGQPLLEGLAAGHENFAHELVGRLLRLLLRKEEWEGLHAVAASSLQNALAPHLHIIERELVFRLLNSPHRPAQELAVLLIERYIPTETLNMRSILRFADNELLAVRQLAWHIFEQNTARVRYERDEAIRLLDCHWDDSRRFGFEFFRRHFTENDWTPELLVGICDSVRADVQAFGRELIARFFRDEDGEQYLLRLAEHPRPEVQLFATNYLERFAAGKPELIQRLQPFFCTVLSQVNKGRTAKDRVFAFLHSQAMQHYPVAQIALPLLHRISATAAVEDRAVCVEQLRDLKQKYPNLENNLELYETP